MYKKLYLALFITCTSLSAQAQDWQQQLPRFVAEYSQWAGEIEQQAFKTGEKLSAVDLEMARKIGVKAPEKIRVVTQKDVPFPKHNKFLLGIGETLGLVGPGVINNAQVFGHAIYVAEHYELDRPRTAHELVHVMQFEREGSFANVLQLYLKEVATYGYDNAPLEVEAYQANKDYALK